VEAPRFAGIDVRFDFDAVRVTAARLVNEDVLARHEE
jgi:hypothetical protein